LIVGPWIIHFRRSTAGSIATANFRFPAERRGFRSRHGAADFPEDPFCDKLVVAVAPAYRKGDDKIAMIAG
jgi:hypothetical protein